MKRNQVDEPVCLDDFVRRLRFVWEHIGCGYWVFEMWEKDEEMVDRDIGGGPEAVGRGAVRWKVVCSDGS
jgi:hypothetical protein